MDNTTELHEDAYDASDGEEAYQGMAAVIGVHGDGELEMIYAIHRSVDDDGDEDDEDDDYVEAGDAEFDEYEPEVDNDVDEVDDFDDEEDGSQDGTIYLDMPEDNATNRFETFLQDVIDAQQDAARGPVHDRTGPHTLDRILAAFSSRLSTRSGRTANTRARQGVQQDPPTTEEGLSNYERRKWIQSWWKKPHTEPQPAGVELLMSGEFGRIGRKAYTAPDGSRNFSRVLRQRSMKVSPMPKQALCEFMVPNCGGTEVATYPSSVYCGQFSADSSFYYVCRKDFNLHVYDMTKPLNLGTTPIYEQRTGQRTVLSARKSIQAIPEGWTITDSHLSPDNERMIYSSMCPTVHMVKTLEDDRTQTSINFADAGRQYSTWGWDDETVIWSCRFSADGNEIIAGGRGKIFVYDLLKDRRTVKISAHNDDVNSCCWADQGSNVLISASDDTFIKVWDRRALGAHARPSGVLIGHTEGITNVSAKGDGRYVVSNGKDQALRLWDLRKMASDAEYRAVKDIFYGLDGFDYRYADDRPQKRPAHPKDCSIMTYRGHMVMRTLIRCHFSPAETTGSRYIYSGSMDGRIHIWSLDGRVVQVLDRATTLPLTFDPSDRELPRRGTSGGPCIRDVSWNSREPIMMSAAWGNHGTGSVAWHEWKGLTKMNGRLEDWEERRVAEVLEKRPRLRRRAVPLRRSARLANFSPGTYNSDSDEDEDDEFYFTDD